MEAATITTQGNTPCLCLHGRIDASVADQLTGTIATFLSQVPGDEVIVDCSDMNYISSAGLRQILNIKKKKPNTRVINCSNDVYSIFEMTGFTQMLDISKTYRTMSVDGCEIVGRGAKGTVYRIDPETVLKVFHDPNALPSILREQALAKEAFVLGIPTAIPYDVVRVGDRYGSVFELLDCDNMASHLSDPDGIETNAKIFADLLRLIHATGISEKLRSTKLPSARQRALDHIACLQTVLPEATFSKLNQLICALPETEKLVHGDLHAKNVMLQNNEALLIDMDTLSYGDPILELAYIFNGYIGRYQLHPEGIKEFMGIDFDLGKQFWSKVLSLYCGTEDAAKLKSVEDRAALIGFSRLLSHMYRKNTLGEGDNKTLAQLYIDKISALTDQLNDLSFASAMNG